MAKIIHYVQKEMNKKVIMWDDGVLDYQIPLESPEKTVLAVWSSKKEPNDLPNLCSKGVKILQASSKNYYLDCGGENFITPGSVWCEYAFWKNIYGKSILDEIP